MKISHQALAFIAAQASSLQERLGSQFVADENKTCSHQVKNRIQHWCKTAAKGNPEQFSRRLAWEDWELEQISPLLGEMRLSAGMPLPVWTNTLQAVVKHIHYRQTTITTSDRCFKVEAPLPFETICLPFVEIARQRLLDSVNTNWELLSRKAHIILERSLLTRLSRIAAQTLQQEFLNFRPLPSQSQQYYQTFVSKLLEDGLISFFSQYSVLAKLMSQVTDFWVESISEFIHRLAIDRTQIEQTFGQQPDRVIALQYALSDAHNRGRTTIGLTFASGLKIIYKPKNLALAHAYCQFLHWLNDRDSPLPWKVFKVIDRFHYGWVEYIEHQPCPDIPAARRYYQRAGMLLCLIYAFGGTDFTCENLIASGEQPVAIDLEMLMCHPVKGIDESGSNSTATDLSQQQLVDSVLRTGLLPRWEYGLNQQGYDASGFGGGEHKTGPYAQPKWHNINTDRMELRTKPVQIPPTANIPTLPNGTKLPVGEYVDDLVKGFEQMYCFFQQKQELLLGENGFLALFSRLPVRFIFRNTRIYGAILNHTLKPQFMENGADRSIQLDLLSRGILPFKDHLGLWQLLKLELEDLENLDIPHFTAPADSEVLPLNSSGSTLPYFSSSAYDTAIALIKNFSEADLIQQVAIIRSALYSKIARQKSTNYTSSYVLSQPLGAITPKSSEQLIESAINIAQELQKRSVVAPDDSVNWIGMTYVPQLQQFQLQPLGDNLYDGRCGVALFLSALFKITKEPAYCNLALGALKPLRHTLPTLTAKSQLQTRQKMGIGGASGLGSIVYALVTISQLLEDKSLLDDGRQAALGMTPEIIAADNQLDVIGGVAGAILGLLSLYQLCPQSLWLERAALAGWHLLQKRTSSSSGFKAWATIQGKLLTGFSHGAAGIAYALLRLYEATNQLEFLEAAQEAIAYENSVFCPNLGNWQDLLAKTPSVRTNWCHGATGIGLARLGGLTILDTEAIRQDMAVAIETTKKFGLQGIDHLCCGNFGRSEFLLVAWQKLKQKELWATIQQQVAYCLERAEKAGGFQLFPHLPPDAYSPGFFQGTAGIGYELLRLAQPDLLPSVLLWE